MSFFMHLSHTTMVVDGQIHSEPLKPPTTKKRNECFPVAPEILCIIVHLDVLKDNTDTTCQVFAHTRYIVDISTVGLKHQICTDIWGQ